MAFADLDIEELLAPIAGETRVGLNPENDSSSERFEIEKAFAVSISDVPDGDEGSQKHDWVATAEQIYDYFGVSKDIWLSINLIRAGANAKRLDIVSLGTGSLKGLMERYWDDFYPTLAEVDFIGRVTPCNSLLSQSGFLRPIQAIPVIRDRRFGNFSCADLIRFSSGDGAQDGYDSFLSALKACDKGSLTQALDFYQKILRDFRDIDGLFDTNSTDTDGNYLGQGPNFQGLYTILENCQRALIGIIPDGNAIENADEQVPTDETDEVASSLKAGPVSTNINSANIESRKDVIRALDAICSYYARKEPGSPVPLLLARAKSWVDMAFLDIMTDLSPDSLDKLREVLSIREKSS